MKYCIFAYIMDLCSFSTMGQSYGTSSKRPFWIDGCHLEGTNSYLEVISAFGYDLQEARDNASKVIMGRRSLATGTEASVTTDGNSILVKSGHNLIVKSRLIDEYIEHTSNGYTVYQLVQTAKNPVYTLESVTLTDRYAFSPMSFIPGMEQIRKGSVVKGSIIISAQVATVAGIVICENMRSSYHKKAIEQPKFVKEYASKARDWSVGRNYAIGAAACVYAYNLIDAIVAKGKMRAVIADDSGVSISLNPTLSQESSGLALTIVF